MNDRLFSYLECRDGHTVIVFIHYDQIIEHKLKQYTLHNHPIPSYDELLYEFMAVYWAVEHH